jgi:O-antigen/teichoic acid export membrane protein
MSLDEASVPAVEPARPLLYGMLRRVGIDRAAGWGSLTAVTRMLFGVVSTLLVVWYLSPSLQGYYYTFGSLMAFQFLVDLGLAQVVIQFASHEWSQLSLDAEGRVVGDLTAQRRLASLGRQFVRWYFVAGILLGVALAGAGFLLLPRPGIATSTWAGPWMLLATITTVRMWLVPVWSLLEGCNQVEPVYRFRLIEGAVYSVSLWLALVLGCGLWALVVSMTAALLYNLGFLYLHYKNFFLTFRHASHLAAVSWRDEIWPFQWRITVGVLGGYLLNGLFVPFIFRFRGAVEAGQLGMTWSLVQIVAGIGGSFVSTKAPSFGMFIARREWDKLDYLFRRALLLSWSAVTVSATLGWLVVWFLPYVSPHLASRILPPLPVGIFLLATVVQFLLVAHSFYVRAHKQEPFALMSLGMGIAQTFFNFYLGSRYGSLGLAWGYLLVHTCTLPVGLVIWYRCRNRWHAPEAS